MVLQNKIYLTNSEVNGGLPINMLAKSINSSQQMFTRTINKPRRTVGSNYTESLSVGTNQGFSNPTHVINGVINLNTAHGNTVIDVEHVQNLINNSHITMTLKCDKFITSTNTSGEIKVMLTNYSDTLTNTNVLEYTMTFVEVRE
jgi:hypothetical protein